jgi:septal ring factor EnvC (AmiA/AmiB activator)
MTDGQWMTYTEAGVRLGINAEAVRRRADRGKWARMPGNDGRTRVRVPDDVRAPQAPPVRADASALVSALEAHIATLKTDIERLTAELAGERAELTGERAARQADQEQLAVERAARQADQEQHQDQLAAERTARQTDQEHAAARQADQEQQLAAARAAADRGTAELVELARRLAAIAETQTSAEPAEAEPEPPRRSKLGRAWGWFLRN